MANTEEPQDVAPKKKSKKPVVIGLVLALVLGAGGFYATFSGMVFGTSTEHADVAAAVAPLPDIAFVPIEPLVVSLGPSAASRHLRIAAQLEVTNTHLADVTLLLPRIVDVMNGYLRAMDVAVLEDPAGLVRMRAQMLRRIQIVTGEGRVRDLLVTEFVLN